MGRVEKRMYRRARGQAVTRRCLLALTVLMIALGLWQRGRQSDLWRAEAVLPPAPTPVTAAFDETPAQRTVELPETVWYAIQTGIFADEDAAKARAALYAGRGAPGYVNRDGGKYRVYIACYEERDAATTVRERLSGQQDVETYLHEWRCGALTLRISGMAGQLDVAEAGLPLPMLTAQRLRETAELLDSGEMTAREAGQVAQSLAEQWQIWSETAKQRFPRPYPALIAQLLAMGEGYQAALSGLVSAAGEGAGAASAAMKVQAMAMFDLAADMRSAAQSE